jgi:methyl-accepting chemotaxis protein
MSSENVENIEKKKNVKDIVAVIHNLARQSNLKF